MDNRTLFERFSDALVYILAFPFIAMFIAVKNAFTKRSQPAHSHRKNLPDQKFI